MFKEQNCNDVLCDALEAQMYVGAASKNDATCGVRHAERPFMCVWK